MDENTYERLIADPPQLHFFAKTTKPRRGGFGRSQFQLIERCISELGGQPRVLETGAGLSTLLFLAKSCSVVSFFTKPDLAERIAVAIDDHGLPRDKWSFVLGRSEFALPKYVETRQEAKFDLLLIDGGHDLHTVFTDFTYGFFALRDGGAIIIDDLRMPSVAVLYGLLRQSRFVEEVVTRPKTAVFRKRSKLRLPGPWGEQSSDGRETSSSTEDDVDEEG